MLGDSPLPYCCPGETESISRALHLGRLASFYPACRACPHRDDTGTLSTRQTRQLLAAHRRAPATTLFDDEGAAGTYLNDFGPLDARRLAAALGVSLVRSTSGSAAPEVVIGGDARPLTAELLSAACEGLRRTGCGVIDIGFASAGSLALAIGYLGASGGLLVGNPTDISQRVGIKFWSGGAMPLSAGGGLGEIRQLFEAGTDRPGRRAGSLRRFSAEELYLASLRPYFHALRPLRVVLDAASLPLRRHVQRLAAEVALEIVPAMRAYPAKTVPQPDVGWPGHQPETSGALPQPPGRGFGDHQLGRQVVARGAHFGLWVDGDGERCRLFDERGGMVTDERLTLALFRHLLKENPASNFVVSEPGSPTLARALGDGARLHPAAATREGVCRRLQETDSVAGAAADRFFFSAARGSSDALRTFAVLLTMLSASDRHLSEVLDAAAASR